jgi:hypothetical protein
MSPDREDTKTMDRGTPTPPTRLDIVPADQVDDLLAREVATLEALGRSATRATATADELERVLRAASVDPVSVQWVYVRLRDFVDELRAEAHAEASALIGAHQVSSRVGALSASPDVTFTAALGQSSSTWLQPSPVTRPDGSGTQRWRPPAPGLAAEPMQAEVGTPRPVVDESMGPSAAEPVNDQPESAVADPEQSSVVVVDGDTSEFWPEDDRGPWRRWRVALSGAAMFRVGALVAAALAVIVHIA